MNTIQMTILLAPLCGHQTFHKDCYMCVNLHVQARKLEDFTKKLGQQSFLGHSGVAVTLESYFDTSGDTSTGEGDKRK